MSAIERDDLRHGNRRLRLWLAGLLNLVTPGLGLFYDGLFWPGLVTAGLCVAGILVLIFLPLWGAFSFPLLIGILLLEGLVFLVSLVWAVLAAWRRRSTPLRFWNDFYGLMFITFAVAAAIEVPWQLVGLPIEAFSIPAGSMAPSLLPGDQLMALHWDRLHRAPRRGEIVIFKLHGTRIDYVKRVVGLPGDTVQLKDNVVIVNGQALRQKPLGDVIYPGFDSSFSKTQMFEETSLDGLTYRILYDPARGGPGSNTQVFVVPPGHVFFLGDNRENSQDSRFNEVGFIPVTDFRAHPLFFYYTANLDRIGADVQ